MAKKISVRLVLVLSPSCTKSQPTRDEYQACSHLQEAFKWELLMISLGPPHGNKNDAIPLLSFQKGSFTLPPEK